MAQHRNEVDILPRETESSLVEKGGYLQNMYLRNGAWEARPGFGQVAQYTTTLNSPSNVGPVKGYQEHLGSYAINTDFGHTQIVSIFTSFCASGDFAANDGTSWSYRYAVSIYDVDSGRRWEELLYKHTGEINEDVRPMQYWRAHNETNSDENYEAWKSASDSSGRVFFVEYQDKVFFGGPEMGLWAYVPADYDADESKQVDYIKNRHFANVHGESSKIIKISPRDGNFSAAYTYIDSAAFPSPVDAAVLVNRLVLADGRDIYFSDIGEPNAIMGTNILPVPCDGEITAISEISGGMYIFTEDETWLYEPPVGSAVVSGGRLTRVSDSIGCIGAISKTRAQSNLYWADARGIYASAGGFKVTNISASIRSLFDTGISNPLSSYYQNNGFTNQASAQPTSFYTWKGSANTSLSFDSLHGMLIVSLPDQRAALVLQGQMWSLWNFESISNSTATTVAAESNVPNPWIIAKDGDVWCIGSMEQTDFTGAESSPDQGKINSYIIMKMGVGGALDRSIQSTKEDQRELSGHYVLSAGTAGSATDDFFVFGKPVKMPIGYKCPRASSGSTKEVFLVPVYLNPTLNTATQPEEINLTFDWDSAKWSPVLISGSAEIDFILPSERHGTYHGFGYGAPTVVAPQRAVARIHSGTGALDPAGTRILVACDVAYAISGAVPAAQRPTFPRLSLTANNLNPIVWIPFTKEVESTTTSMNISLVAGTYKDTRTPLTRTTCSYVWRFSDFAEHSADDVAQPVDWAVKCAQFGLGDGFQVLARSVYIKMLSHGKATTRMNPNWIHGLLNLNMSSDWKDWAGQVIDYTDSTTKIEKTLPLRARMKDSAGNMKTRVFNNAAKWANTGNNAHGNYLVDDEQFDTISMSSRVRGEHVSHMLFGHLANRAERLVISSIKAVMKRVGQRRRRGR